MSYKGNNILGDKKYKKKFKKFVGVDSELEDSIISLNRQFLHAKTIGFNHPSNNTRLEFASNLPSDLEKILKKPAIIGIGYEYQIHTESFSEPHDIKYDCVITEERIHRF